MHLCRNAWQKLVPLTHRGAAALRNASVRQMSSGSVPGSSGETLPYYIFVGVVMTGGGIYAYRTVGRDRARFNERHEYISTQLKPVMESIESKSDTVEASAVLEAIEEAVESAIEEASAEEVIEQEAAPTTPLEEEHTAAEDEAASTEQEPAPTEEPEPSTEAASEQVESETVRETVDETVRETVDETVKETVDETVRETVDEMSPVLDASLDNIAEELASAAEDWSELTARKPEETEEESAPAALDIEDAVESEQESASS